MTRKSIDKLKLISPEELCEEDFFEHWLEGELIDKIEVLQKLKVGQGIILADSRENLIPIKGRNNAQYLESKLREYQRAGLDVGKGDCEFGYRMPLPNCEDNNRELIIFRRNEGSKEEIKK